MRLYDTKTRALTDLAPVVPGQVGIYVCGPTVQSEPHIGHLRSAIVYDILDRWLQASGYRVRIIRNVTDIDDKVLARADHETPWWSIAYRVENQFADAYRAVGVRRPTYEPRATASIPEMHALIERLIERGHAYPATDGSGDVYFDAASWPKYGALTHQRLADMESATDADPRGKKDPRDFALWKGQKPGEPADAAWESPWGRGRPGWHIECSAMSSKYLGDAFDIHGGGLDLRFPHHENELAQSEAAGLRSASIWMHNGLVNLAGQKMSKSLGNFITAADYLKSARPIAVRYLLGAAHYRSAIDVEPRLLVEADAALSRIEKFLDRAPRENEVAPGDLPAAFVSAMNDDLNVPMALAAVHEGVRSGNSALDAGDDDTAAQHAGEVRAMIRIIGIDPAAPEWQGGTDRSADTLAAVVDGLIAARARARAEKNFAAADRIRDDLQAAGITLEDGAAGTNWSI